MWESRSRTSRLQGAESILEYQDAWTRLTSPSPSGAIEDLGADVASNEGVNDEREGHQPGYETAPLKSCYVGNNDLREKLETCVTTGEAESIMFENTVR